MALSVKIKTNSKHIEKRFQRLKSKFPSIIDKGILQAKELGKKWDNLDKIQKVFVSPLTRTLQTTENIFKDKIGLKIIALDGIKEFPQGMETCNKRREKKELEMNFKNIDFSELDSDTDQMWREDRFETIEELEQRIEDFKNFSLAGVAKNSFLIETLVPISLEDG